MGEIVVTGAILSAQQESIGLKRDAVNLTDIAASDSVGRFPDQNAAAALSRLPAVAVQRDQGQERYIQVRGAPNRWTSVSIDGIPMVGVDEGGDTRAFRFDAIPAVLLSQMVINKSLTSDLQADAVVATIDLRTYSPMDRKGLHVSGDAGYGMMDLGGGEQRQGSLRLSWSNDTVGIVLGGSHYLRDQVTDNREAGYDEETGEPNDFSVRNYKLERYDAANIGAKYTFGNGIMVDGAFGQGRYDFTTSDNHMRLRFFAVGTRIPVGQWTFSAQASQIKFANFTKGKDTGVMLGTEYALSKRTALFARAVQIRDDEGQRADAGLNPALGGIAGGPDVIATTFGFRETPLFAGAGINPGGTSRYIGAGIRHSF